MSEWITVNPLEERKKPQPNQGGWVTVNPVPEEELLRLDPRFEEAATATVEAVKESPKAFLRGAIKAVEGFANILPETLNLALQSPPGLNRYQDPQLPTLDIPKPDAPKTPLGQAAEIGGELTAAFFPVGKAAGAASSVVKAARAPKIPVEIARALASRAEQDAVYARFTAKAISARAIANAVEPEARVSARVTGQVIEASEAATKAAESLTPVRMQLAIARRGLPAKME